MIFTLYYMYATFLQWWRLGTLKNKLNGTLNGKNALLVGSKSAIFSTRKDQSIENLLFHKDDRIACTIVPKRKVNLTHWVTFPRKYKYFPIYFRDLQHKLESPNIYILVQAVLDTYTKHQSEIIEVENFGELIAWKASDFFEAILKTDIDKLTKLTHYFTQNDVDINHELKLLRVELIEVEGSPTRIQYDKVYTLAETLKYSYHPNSWKRFVTEIKDLYSKIRDVTNPKIMIENGTTSIQTKSDLELREVKKSKPKEKENKNKDDKNTLEVSSSEKRRHKSDHSKKEKVEKHLKEIPKFKEDKVKHDERKKEKLLKKESKSSLTATSAEAGPSSENKIDSKTDVNLTGTEPKINEIKKDESISKTDSADKTEHQKKAKDKKEKLDIKKEKTDPKKDKCDSKKSSKKSEEKDSSKVKEKSDKVSRSRSKDKADYKLEKTAAVEIKNGDLPSSSQANGSIPRHLNKEECSKAKPPNLLVFADSLVAKENVKSVLHTMVNKDKYTIYDLPTNPETPVWNNSTELVIVCGNVPQHLTAHLLQFLISGGQLLCLCSDLLYSVLHTFTTAEVREHELVRFTYGQWKQVQMMHHIFCYQASPAKKQFSKDSDNSNQSSGNGSSPVAPRTPSTVDIQHNGKDYTIQVQVLGTEETWQTPSLLLATVKGSKGRAIFSQVHLEIDPNEYEDDENKFEALKKSNQARIEILRDILSNHLNIDCSSNLEIAYTTAYFLGRHDLKQKMLSECESIVNNKLICDKITVAFHGKDVKPEDEKATAIYLPILILSCPANFSTVNYFETLNTEFVGRLVIYSDVLASSQHLLSRTLHHGIVVIPRQQTAGVGRSNNAWISPVGSAMFSLQLHIPLSTPLGRALSLVQQIIMVSVISAIKNVKGCENLEIGIKWPNDLYANGSVKIGGLIVNSTINNTTAILNIGCGVNLDNLEPTTCINELIRQESTKTGCSIKSIAYETYFALVFNEIERIFKLVQDDNLDYFFDLYYKYWLHSNSDISITAADGSTKKVRIVGIDSYGFLKVCSENGTESTVTPDGNSFDMLKGLIAPKIY